MAANGLPIRVIEVRPCQIGQEFCLDVQQLIPVPAYQDFYSDINRGPSAKARSGTGSTVVRRQRLGRAELYDAGLIKSGDTIHVSIEPEKKATLVDQKFCEYNGEKISIFEFAKRVTGCSSVNIFQVVVREETGQTFGELRERLEAELEEEPEKTVPELEAIPAVSQSVASDG